MCKSERHPGDEVLGPRISSGLDTRLCARIPSVSAPMVVLPCTLFDRDCRIGSQRTGVGQVLETTTARDFSAISDAWTFWGQLLSRVLLVARLLRLHMFSSLNVKKIAGHIITVESKVIYICTAWSCMAPSLGILSTGRLPQTGWIGQHGHHLSLYLTRKTQRVCLKIGYSKCNN